MLRFLPAKDQKYADFKFLETLQKSLYFFCYKKQLILSQKSFYFPPQNIDIYLHKKQFILLSRYLHFFHHKKLTKHRFLLPKSLVFYSQKSLYFLNHKNLTKISLFLFPKSLD